MRDWLIGCVLLGVVCWFLIRSHRRFMAKYKAMTPEQRDAFDADMQTW
jgi:hypothetical protein